MNAGFVVIIGEVKDGHREVKLAKGSDFQRGEGDGPQRWLLTSGTFSGKEKTAMVIAAAKASLEAVEFVDSSTIRLRFFSSKRNLWIEKWDGTFKNLHSSEMNISKKRSRI